MRFSKKIKGKYRGIIFDFDDTIAKTKPGKNTGLRIVSLKIFNFLKKEGIEVVFNELYGGICEAAQKIDAKGIYDRNLWWKEVINKFSKKIPPRSFLDKITKDYWEAVIKKSAPYEDTFSLLSYLRKKGYALGMLTDTDGVEGFKLKRIKALNLKKQFDSIVVAGEDTKETKPDNPPFFLISKKLNLKSNECVFVGNDLYRDILGAKKAGMAAILIKRRECEMKVKPDRVIRKLGHLKEIL